jgi:hypothetical protein
MSGALYLMTQNGMVDTGLMAIVFIAFVLVMMVGGVAMLVDWVKARFKK